MALSTPNTIPDAPSARRVWDLVAGLKVPFGYERSFRLCRGAIFPDRFLLSLGKGSLGTRPDSAILDLCRRLDLPEHALRTVAQVLPGAWFVHFGFEQGRTSSLYKIYLETGLPPGRPQGPEPVLLHRAWKWDPSDPSRCVLTRYLWYPGLSVPDLLGRLARIHVDRTRAEALDVARNVVQLAAERVGPEGLRYLEVVEDGNARRSFDLNLYPTGLTVADLEPQLLRVVASLAIPEGAYVPLLEALRPKPVGHLAGGVHRAGEEFFTVYHGVEECGGASGAAP